MTSLSPSRRAPRRSAVARASALRASIWPRWASNTFRLEVVARSAFWRGSRKLRAKPSLTVTTSPMTPRCSTRSRRTTFIDRSPLLHDVGQQRQEAGALDGAGQLTLLRRGNRGDARRDDLAALGDI